MSNKEERFENDGQVGQGRKVHLYSIHKDFLQALQQLEISPRERWDQSLPAYQGCNSHGSA